MKPRVCFAKVIHSFLSLSAFDELKASALTFVLFFSWWVENQVKMNHEMATLLSHSSFDTADFNQM